MSSRTREYITTESGNRLSRRGLNLVNTQAIVLAGKTIVESHVTMRGDLTRHPRSVKSAATAAAVVPSIQVGRYCLFSSHVTLLPPHQVRSKHQPNNQVSSKSQFLEQGRSKSQEHGGEEEEEEKVHHALKMGDYIFVGEGSIVEAASIASCVHIGRDVKIGNMCIIKEGSVIEDECHLAPYSVVAPFSRVRGRPGIVVGETPEVMMEVIRERQRENYARVVAAATATTAPAAAAAKS